MDLLQLYIGKEDSRQRESWRVRLGRALLVQKLHHPFMVALMFVVGISLAAVIALKGIVPAALFIIFVVAVPVVYGIIAYPRFGIVLMLVIAYVIMWVMRLGINFPLGTLMDGLQALLLFGFFLKMRARGNWEVFKNPISYLVLIWIGYNLLQVANPSATSRLAWVYTLRSVAVLMLMYFIFVYNIRTVGFIKLILKIWIVLATVGAAYGFYQETFGYLPFEQNWINSDPLITELYFIAGHWRKFAIFSDPVAFAYNMVASSLLCFCISTGPIARWKKVVLISLGVFHIMAMLFSGTRGAYVLLPAAMGMYCILRFNKRIMLFAIAGGLMMGALILVPTGNPTLVRFQSAFKPSDDASFNVRSINQKKIQPYILTHPMGGGLGATGVWGQRFSPGTYLASFPPDSGYVRVAVELGWIGLFLFCLLMFTILKKGVDNYFFVRDRELRSYSLAMLLIVFALNIGNYPQEALVQFPTNIYFYLVVALITVLPTIDKRKHEQPPITA